MLSAHLRHCVASITGLDFALAMRFETQRLRYEMYWTSNLSLNPIKAGQTDVDWGQDE